MRAVRAGLLLALPGLALLSACGRREPAPAGRLELASWAPAAESWVETAALDIGAPEARPFLGSGWGEDESSGAASFAWGKGQSSEIRWDLVEERELTLELVGWSYPFPLQIAQQVELWVNGKRLGQEEIGSSPTKLQFRIASGDLRVGPNWLELRYARAHEAAGEEPLAVAWDLIRVRSGVAVRAPRIAGGEGVLELPAGSAAAWALELPPGTDLVWDDVARRGSVRATIDVERGAPSRIASTAASEGGRLRLTASGTGSSVELVGFTLRAVGREGSASFSGLRLESPAFTSLKGAVVDAVSPSEAVPPTVSSGSPPNLVLYLVDTLRPDHLATYGYERPTSPHLDSFARGAILVREARAQSAWTKPAVATILTGLAPQQHRTERRNHRLPDEITTLAERLSAAGYETAMFTTNPTVTEKFGFAQGFDEYRYESLPRGKRRGHVDSLALHRAVVDWLDRRAAGKPFFLVVHTLDPHDPYRPDEPFASRFAGGIDVERSCCPRTFADAGLTEKELKLRARDALALYDAEIAQNDASFGALVEELDRRGLLEKSSLWFTSDHGEEFHEHGGWRHGHALYEELLRIPLVVRLPGAVRGGSEVAGPVDQLDFAPTLLDLAGVAVPVEMPGASWLPAWSGSGAAPAAAELSLARLHHPAYALLAVASGGWKWIGPDSGVRESRGRGVEKVFDLRADPFERRSLARSLPLRRRWLRGQAVALQGGGGETEGEAATIDPELDRTLRALGYL